MIKKSILFLLLIFISSCKPEAVKEKEPLFFNKEKKFVKNSDSSSKKEVKKLQLNNGIVITFYTKGTGEKLKKFDVVKIDYKVRLKDSTIVDGNHLLKKEWLPFIIGFNMQTPGWDLALSEMNIGDEAEIFLPSKLARGENGIKGLIPPNADNYIRIKIVDKLPPTKVVEGTKIWLLEENKTENNKATLQSTIEFHYMVSTPSNPRYDISYRKNKPYTFKFSDFGIVKGLKKALLGVKKSDKMWVLIPSSQAYGSKGLMNLIQPNEPVFYDLFVMDVRK
ncbi:MAG: FKBP-type peptidyl-prolyl cis-trans isomerase [Flavobacteriia bacterium]|nr:FKBP-type peptidyl-prolyl cis-trans isomerase [Flavobacteriia bacterium]